MASDRTVTVELTEFGWERLAAEARRQGTSPEELALHAVIYYLADIDGGRITRRAPRLSDEPERRVAG